MTQVGFQIDLGQLLAGALALFALGVAAWTRFEEKMQSMKETMMDHSSLIKALTLENANLKSNVYSEITEMKVMLSWIKSKIEQNAS